MNLGNWVTLYRNGVLEEINNIEVENKDYGKKITVLIRVIRKDQKDNVGGLNYKKIIVIKRFKVT